MMDEYSLLDESSMGDIAYSLKTLKPELYRHYEGHERTPKEMKEAVLKSDHLKRVMEQICEQSGRSAADVEGEVVALLEEMGHKFFIPAVRTLAVIVRNALRRITKGIYINTSGIEKVKEAMRQWPTVLLPSHRSYLDFILVTYVFFHFNMRLPVIAAGQDFMEMAVVSSFLRRSGAFFMRRTFGSDLLYWSVFSEYVQQHLSTGYAPVEFFIEGTRSRTAKSYHPKLGLLSVVMEPYLSGSVADVMFVPISVSYERTLEEELFAREQLGVPKPKESTKGLFKATSILSEDYGKIFITLGDPVSLHEYCTSQGISRVGQSLVPKGVVPGQLVERTLALNFGYSILDKIHKGMKLPITSLVATVLLQNSNDITLNELFLKVSQLSYAVSSAGGVLMESKITKETVAGACALLHVSVQVKEGGVVSIVTNGNRMQRVSEDTQDLNVLSKVYLSPNDMAGVLQDAFSHLMLGHYRNQILHLFLNEAILVAAVQGADTPSKGVVLHRFKVLRNALKKEFVFPTTSRPSTPSVFQDTLQALVDRSILTLEYDSHSKSELIFEQSSEQVEFLVCLVLPFIATTWVTCGHLLSLSGGVESLTGVQKQTQRLAAKCVVSGAVGSLEILSLDIIRNSLASLTAMGVLSQVQGEFNTETKRLVKVLKREELQEVHDILGSIVAQERSSYGSKTEPLQVITAKL
jgi:glycerone phosphate O-acyltransferase